MKGDSPNELSHWAALRERVGRASAPTRRSLRPEYHRTELLAAEGPSNVHYWNDAERAAGRVSFVNGRLQLDGQLLGGSKATRICSRHWFDERFRFGYVLSRDDDGAMSMYLFKPDVGETHHSSPVEGRPVVDAGMLTVVNGKVAYFEHKSGHYKPNREQVLHTLHFMKKNGVDLSGVYCTDHIPRPSFIDTTISPEYFANLVEGGHVPLWDASRLYQAKSFDGARFDVPRGADIEELTRLRVALEPTRGAEQGAGRACGMDSSAQQAARPDYTQAQGPQRVSTSGRDARECQTMER